MYYPVSEVSTSCMTVKFGTTISDDMCLTNFVGNVGHWLSLPHKILPIFQCNTCGIYMGNTEIWDKYYLSQIFSVTHAITNAYSIQK